MHLFLWYSFTSLVSSSRGLSLLFNLALAWTASVFLLRESLHSLWFAQKLAKKNERRITSDITRTVIIHRYRSFHYLPHFTIVSQISQTFFWIRKTFHYKLSLTFQFSTPGLLHFCVNFITFGGNIYYIFLQWLSWFLDVISVVSRWFYPYEFNVLKKDEEYCGKI